MRFQIVFDTMGHDSPEVVDKLYLEKLRKSEIDDKDPACARRFVIPEPHTMDVSQILNLNYYIKNYD